MDSLYTNEIRRFIQTRSWPPTLIWEIVEFEDCLKLRLFRENINSLDSDEKLHLAKLVNETFSSIRKDGVPIYTWVAKGDGRNDTT